jgi:DNA-binding MarR family transcriptional regulator
MAEVTTSARSALPPLPCACASLRRASRALTQLYDEAVRPYGLRVTQFTVLQVLDRVGEIGQGRLGEILAMDSTSLSRTLRLLEQSAWIGVSPGEDRRERRIRLTAKGRDQLARAVPAWSEVQRRLQTVLGRPRWTNLFGVLDQVTEAVQRA